MAKPKERPDAKAKTPPPPAPQSSPEVVVAPVVTAPLETPAETQPAAGASSPRWLIALLLLGLLAILFWVLYRGFGGREPILTNSALTTPNAGGMVVESTATITGTTPSAGAATAPSVEPTKPAGLQPGQTVAANSSGELRLYSDASTTSPIRDVYAAGALFTVLEPSGQYTEYPVLVNDQQWYRVRAADGLVGWAPLDAFDPATDTPQATPTTTG